MVMLRATIVVLSLAVCTNALYTFLAGDFEKNEAFPALQVREKRQAAVPDPTISTYHILSTVTARFVSTTVLVTVENDADLSQEVRFGFIFNPDAFISGFLMTINDVSYVAKVKEKEAAQRAYTQARRRGQSAAQVRQKAQSSRFFVDVNLAASTTVVFNLTYQELLRRDKGLFKHRINAAPGQVVDDFRVEVVVIEPQGITVLESSWEPTDATLEPLVLFNPPAAVSASVLFNPSRAAQSSVSRTSGLNGVLEVRYDVQHALDGGDLQVVNGYFVHHISPEGLPPAPKKVIFVIDTSGSMYGNKIAQTKVAMDLILDQLRPIDSFNIMTFSHVSRAWKTSAIPATRNNKRLGKEFVSRLNPTGGTNIYGPLIDASRQFRDNEEAFPAIIFLTDGRPNAGVIGTYEIVAGVKRNLKDRVALFCIGFGNDVDDILLTRLSSENQGIYRKVFADSSAALQMQNFFEEVATPLLFNIAVQYLNGAVDADSLIGGNTISYFDGKEVLVAGKLADGYEGNELVALVEARGRRDISLQVSKELNQVLDPGMVADFAQRMWAFLTIKDYLAKEKLSSSQTEKAELKQKALDLSLKYSFVTPLTSLLVIKPEDIVPTTAAPLTTLPIPTPLQPNLPSAGGQLPQSNSRASASQQFRLSASRVGADPHFIIDVPYGNLTICFDLQADAGTLINLLSDPVLDIHVNAEVIPVEKSVPVSPVQSDSNPLPSLLGSLGISLGHYKVLISPKHVLLDNEIYMPWDTSKTIILDKYNITIQDGHHLSITIGDNIYLKVLMHTQWKDHPVFFDFTMESAGGFSNAVHGLLGQFQHKEITMKDRHRGESLNGHIRGVVETEGHEEFVYKMNETVGITTECWWALPEKYIDGETKEYFVSDIFSELYKFFL
ncbi:inter-alpha-trypsin inhibitor heavy chain H3-like isoform X3 [Apostichopus japonicus]|uniref:inter-alpha-trypsin inhibitor heavy chain H3-like isoform X3 n=1 Tax=Stichopus japonicus TaxID=307972 RepID=UPI003AB85C9B